MTLRLQCIEFGKEGRDMDDYARPDDPGASGIDKSCDILVNLRHGRPAEWGW